MIIYQVVPKYHRRHFFLEILLNNVQYTTTLRQVLILESQSRAFALLVLDNVILYPHFNPLVLFPRYLITFLWVRIVLLRIIVVVEYVERAD